MRIRRYVLTVAFYDDASESEFGVRAIEDVIDHGMLERAGASAVEFIDERLIDYPDIDWGLPAEKLVAATEAWDLRAYEEVYGVGSKDE